MNTTSRAALNLAGLMAAGCVVATAGQGIAQDQTSIEVDSAAPQDTGTAIDDIIVTARKRQESVLNVPVVATVVSGEVLQEMQVNSISDLQKIVPGLNMGTATLSIGSIISLRGIGTSSNDAGVDQSVSVNIDGLPFSQGLAITSGMFDVQGVEVLKGPQALFYGKASPGGVISLRTADPSSRFEMIGRAAHEFEAQETRGEFIISGPVTETLRLRLASMVATSEGYYKNTAVPFPNSGAASPPSRAGGADNYIVRGTALWAPNSRFDARLKLNLTHDKTTMSGGEQYGNCPDGLEEAPSGIPFLGGENCIIDRNIALVAMDPNSFTGIRNGGVPYVETKQRFGTFEGTYHVNEAVDLTSTTGFYDLESSSLMNTYASSNAGTPLAVANDFSRRDFTQEFRLDSDFSSPFNFTLGAFYQDANQVNRVNIMGNKAYAFSANTYTLGEISMDIETYSAFGQGRWQVTPQIELAAGARWTKETRSEEVTNLLTGLPINVLVPEISSSNIAPEATITYRPTDDLTLFGAFKKGFKSGSFSMSTIPGPGGNNSFGDESVEGGEAGIKARLFDRTMNLNIAGYHYDYNGLQVGATLPAAGGVPVIRTVNAGAARAYGIDMDATYYPRALPNLSLNMAVNWNHTRYTDFANAPCYAGQTIGEGCDQVLNPITKLYTAQDLTANALVRAPDWEASFGFDYDIDLANGYRLSLTNSNKYTSSYFTASGLNRPDNDNIQDAFIKSNVGVTMTFPDERWQLSLIGNNISDEVVAGNCPLLNAANGGILGGQITGGPSLGVAGRAELNCFTERGRSVWLRLSFRH